MWGIVHPQTREPILYHDVGRIRGSTEEEVKQALLDLLNLDRASRNEPSYTWEVLCEVFEDAPWGEWIVGEIAADFIHPSHIMGGGLYCCFCGAALPGGNLPPPADIGAPCEARPSDYECCGTCGYDHAYDGFSPEAQEEIHRAHQNDE